MGVVIKEAVESKIVETRNRSRGPKPKVFGVLEKRWGELMCAHGHEAAPSLMKLPDFPSK